MKFTYPPLLAFLLIPWTGSLLADSVILKDGSEIKGTIIEEGPNGVTIEYQATPTIKDQRVIAQAEIARVEKNTPDQKEFQELGSLETPATVTDASYYDPLIDKLTKFIQKYPDSALNPQASERLKTLTDEREKVQKGDRRIDSVWHPASELREDPYQAEALVKFSYLKAEAASNNAVSALKTYELIEKSYPGAAVIPDAVPLTLLQLQSLDSQLNIAKANGEVELKNFSAALAAEKRADIAQKMKDSMQLYENAAKSAMAAASADGSKFFPVFQKSKESMSALQALITTERTRLAQFPVQKMKEGIGAAREGLRLIKLEKIKEARDQLALSEKLWPANHDNTKLKERIAQLDAAISANSSTAAKQAAADEAEKKARKLALEKAEKEAAEKAAKEASVKAAQEAAEKAAKEAALKANLDSAKESAGLATPTPTPSAVEKLNENREIINVLSK
jgi:hypothetical protein